MSLRKLEILVFFNPVSSPSRVEHDSVLLKIAIEVNDFLSLHQHGGSERNKKLE
jgi:hypothetical protein